MDFNTNLTVLNETFKSQYKQLKVIVDELQDMDMDILISEKAKSLKQELRSILNFCQGDYKFSFLIQGEMNAGKSTCLNALLGERILAVSSVPETNFLTCIVPDRAFDVPMLYTTLLSKIYDAQTSTFHINEAELEFTGISGINNVYHHLNACNEKSRQELNSIVKKAEEDVGNNNKNSELQEEIEKKIKEGLYKNAKLTDTVFVIKCRIPWLEERIKDEFILKRIQFIDFPGMFEYGHNNIAEIYKVFDDASQGRIHIVNYRGYEKNIITKLQDYKKYPNRMLVIANKMDQIRVDDDDDASNSNDVMNSKEKATLLLKKIKGHMEKLSHDSKGELQKTKYLELSQEVDRNVHFVASMDELIKVYVLKYQNSKTQQEKEVWNSMLTKCVEDDRNYDETRKEAKEDQTLLAEAGVFNDIAEDPSNLLDRVKDSLQDKFRNRFQELVLTYFPNKIRAIRDSLIEILKPILEKSSIQCEDDKTHSFVKCDGCGEQPLVGIRYRCKECEDFDFCETCKQKNNHPIHEFDIIPKENLTGYLVKISLGMVEAVNKSMDKFLEKIQEHLRSIMLSFQIVYSKNQDKTKDIKNILTTQCDQYQKLQEQILKENNDSTNNLMTYQLIILSLLNEKNQTLDLIMFIQLKDLIDKFLEEFKVTSSLTISSFTSYLKAIIKATAPKDQSLLAHPVFTDKDSLATLLTAVYSDESVSNLSEFLRMMINYIDNFRQLITSSEVRRAEMRVETLHHLFIIGEVRDQLIDIWDDAKVIGQLKEKVSTLLEKLKAIN